MTQLFRLEPLPTLGPGRRHDGSAGPTYARTIEATVSTTQSVSRRQPFPHTQRHLKSMSAGPDDTLPPPTHIAVTFRTLATSARSPPGTSRLLHQQKCTPDSGVFENWSDLNQQPLTRDAHSQRHQTHSERNMLHSREIHGSRVVEFSRNRTHVDLLI